MVVDPEKTRNGRPCGKCGETLRWKIGRHCVRCKRERGRDGKRDLNLERLNAGLCVDCGQPGLSEWYCWDCLNKREEQRAFPI